MNCSRCQHENPSGVKFCGECGGNQQQAKAHLTTATTMMREMKMGLWLEKAEAELKELG